MSEPVMLDVDQPVKAINRLSANGFQEKVAARLRLNIGGGDKDLPGFTVIDRKFGGEACPLRYNDGTPVPDACADEVYSSHLLEHFSFREVEGVLREWVRVLKPGGRLRVAVPDFTHIAKAHLGRSSEPYLSHLFGSQGHSDDFHRCAFDRQSLANLLRTVGLRRVRPWQAVIQDCASLPCSLNLEGTKGIVVAARHKLPKLKAVLSLPRLAFTDTMFCALGTCGMLGIPFVKTQGVYWDQCLERCLTALLEKEPDLEYVLTIDYDSVFRPQDIQALCDLAVDHPEADAIAPLQVRRGDGQFMMYALQPDGTDYQPGTAIRKSHFDADLTRTATAHFGLTLLKTATLKTLPHPWFKAVPNKDDRWEDGRTDADIYFWDQWRARGHSIYLASRVPIGHSQLLVSWPKDGGGVVHQTSEAFWDDEEPDGLWM